MTELEMALYKALSDLHSCHRAFSANDNWTALDDEAREQAEAALEQAELSMKENNNG